VYLFQLLNDLTENMLDLVFYFLLGLLSSWELQVNYPLFLTVSVCIFLTFISGGGFRRKNGQVVEGWWVYFL
jgi:hypothetical protein